MTPCFLPEIHSQCKLLTLPSQRSWRKRCDKDHSLRCRLKLEESELPCSCTVNKLCSCCFCALFLSENAAPPTTRIYIKSRWCRPLQAGCWISSTYINRRQLN